MPVETLRPDRTVVIAALPRRVERETGHELLGYRILHTHVCGQRMADADPVAPYRKPRAPADFVGHTGEYFRQGTKTGTPG
jgi:hypothetical protein